MRALGAKARMLRPHEFEIAPGDPCQRHCQRPLRLGHWIVFGKRWLSFEWGPAQFCGFGFSLCRGDLPVLRERDDFVWIRSVRTDFLRHRRPADKAEGRYASVLASSFLLDGFRC